MGFFEFDKCCFCVDLKTGCFIIAYLSLVDFIIKAIWYIIIMGVGGVVASDEKDPDIIKIIMIGAGLLLLFTVILLTFIIVLLVGLHKNKQAHVKAFLIYAGIYIGVSVLLLIVKAASGGSKGSDIAWSAFDIVWSIYSFLVIRSQYLVH